MIRQGLVEILLEKARGFGERQDVLLVDHKECVFCNSAEYVGVSGCLLLWDSSKGMFITSFLTSHSARTFAYNFCFYSVFLIWSDV